MNLKVLTANHPDIPAVKALYEDAFPANERGMSMDMIVANMDKMPIKLFGIYTVSFGSFNYCKGIAYQCKVGISRILDRIANYAV